MGKRIGAVVAVLATLSLFAAYRFVQDAQQFVAEEAQRQETAEQAQLVADAEQHKLAEEEVRQIGVATEQAAVEARQKDAERQAAAAAAKAMREEQQQAAAAAAAAASTWKSSAIDWQDTQLGPGFPDPIGSAWSDIGVLREGGVVRIEADGFNGKAPEKLAGWGWYLNIWSGNGRNWVNLKGKEEPSRMLHFNPRPRGGAYVAMNNFFRGKGWGKEKDVPAPTAWRIENAGTPFVLEVEAGADELWTFNLNGEPQPDLSYTRKGFENQRSPPLILQMYDLINPRVSVKHN